MLDMNRVNEADCQQHEGNEKKAVLTMLLGGLAIAGGNFVPRSPDSIRDLGAALFIGGFLVLTEGAIEIYRARDAKDQLSSETEEEVE